MILLHSQDGVELPPTIGFDINDEVKLPVAKASFLCEPAGSDIVRQFLEQYFILFDSDNRQQLLNAYHVDAMMSLTCTNNQHQTNDQKLVSLTIDKEFCTIICEYFLGCTLTSVSIGIFSE